MTDNFLLGYGFGIVTGIIWVVVWRLSARIKTLERQKLTEVAS